MKMLLHVTFTVLLSLTCSTVDAAVLARRRNDVRGLHLRSLQQPPPPPLPVVGHVDQIVLYNAMTDQPIRNVTDGMVLNLATLWLHNATRFSIVATTTTSTTGTSGVGSVGFGYNGQENVRIENMSPYSLCGDKRADLFECSMIGVGQHNITVTTYSGTMATGTIGSTKKVSFRIVNDSSSPKLTAPTTQAPVTMITSPPISAPTESSCRIPKFESDWERVGPNFPFSTVEAQADIIGNDLISTGGFTNAFTSVTNRTYARDVSVVNSPWRRMDDMPVPTGITHAATVTIGTKMYMCGGYLGPHPGGHIPLCFIYDHSKAPRSGQQWSNFTNLPNNGTGAGGMIYDSVSNALYYSGGARRQIVERKIVTSVDYNDTWKISLTDPKFWVRSVPIPYRANHESHVTVKYQGQDRHYFVGGQIGENETQGNIDFMYELMVSSSSFNTTATWIDRASMPFPRSHTTISTRAYRCGFIMAGGIVNSFGPTRTSNIQYYDIPTNSWTYIGEIPIPISSPKVFIHTNSTNNIDYLYYVDSARTSRRNLSA